MTDVFEYRDAEHLYLLNNEPIPSVTHALKASGLNADLDNVPPATLEYARRRGGYVDACLRLLDKGELDESRVHPEAMGYIGAYRKWQCERKFTFPVWGKPTWAEFEGMKYGMTTDVTGMLGDSRALVDIKCTSAIPKSLGPQLAAYRIGIPAGDWLRIGVQLFPDGTYRQYEYESESDFDRWYCALYSAYWEPGRKLTSRRKKVQKAEVNKPQGE